MAWPIVDIGVCEQIATSHLVSVSGGANAYDLLVFQSIWDNAESASQIIPSDPRRAVPVQVQMPRVFM